jgi:hypothetical protein
MNQITSLLVGAVIGGIVSFFLSILLRSVEEWRAFEVEMSFILDRISQAQKTDLLRVYIESVSDVSAATHRARPYFLFSFQVRRVTSLLREYREAKNRQEWTGTPPNPLKPETTGSCLPDYDAARSHLQNLLREMMKYFGGRMP